MPGRRLQHQTGVGLKVDDHHLISSCTEEELNATIEQRRLAVSTLEPAASRGSRLTSRTERSGIKERFGCWDAHTGTTQCDGIVKIAGDIPVEAHVRGDQLEVGGVGRVIRPIALATAAPIGSGDRG
jgi:hypothetical protein